MTNENFERLTMFIFYGIPTIIVLSVLIYCALWGDCSNNSQPCSSSGSDCPDGYENTLDPANW